MQGIGNTAEVTAAQIKALKQSIFDVANQTGQSTTANIQAGIGTLAAVGLDVGRSKASIIAIRHTATAESVNVNDLSKASITLIDIFCGI
ncbi:MAG TPA: hypothetical protein VFK31_06455 [Rhodanobacteraceae bacterium]|nr:hypothetical protein [Rhodanobacteraceae bacterium]